MCQAQDLTTGQSAGDPPDGCSLLPAADGYTFDNILRCVDAVIVVASVDRTVLFVSPAAKSLFVTAHLRVGGPVIDLLSVLEDPDLQKDISAALDRRESLSADVRRTDGGWYTRRICPCQMENGSTRGVTITFNDVSLIKSAAISAEFAKTYADSVIDALHQPLIVIDSSLHVLSSNRSFRRTFTAPGEDILGRCFKTIGGGRFNVKLLSEFLDHTRNRKSPIENCEITIDPGADGWQILLVSARKIIDKANGESRILLAFNDITEQKQTSAALEIAKTKAERANQQKTRFLAAASHDLRQPLQTLSLLQGMLARKTLNPESLSLIGKLGETLGAMAGMLDTLLDINQLETGNVRPDVQSFDVMKVFTKLDTEFTYLANAKGLSLTIVPSSLRIKSDPQLFAQILRNLLSNAIKYTKSGRILIGCRRVADRTRVEVWDTGIGIPENQLDVVFDEYHQLENAARERGLGLGLGLSIVRRIAELLGHPASVRSKEGKGSVFTLEAPLALVKESAGDGRALKKGAAPLPALILIVEDDPTVREAMTQLFKSEGYRTFAAAQGTEVSAILQHGHYIPDAIVADYNLPDHRTGLDIVIDLRRATRRNIPAVILTGDISTAVKRKIVAAECEFLHKPVNVDQLTRRVADFVAAAKTERISQETTVQNVIEEDHGPVFVIDDDLVLLEAMGDMLQSSGYTVELHSSAASFLASYQPSQKGCLIVDSVMPGMSGLDLLRRLKVEKRTLPSIVITGYGDVAMAILAMKAGAIDFIEKPAGRDELLASVGRALLHACDLTRRSAAQQQAAANIASLTKRERQVMDLVVEGIPNKQIAFRLGISQRTVETHRAAVMKRTGVDSLPDLIRLVMQVN